MGNVRKKKVYLLKNLRSAKISGGMFYQVQLEIFINKSEGINSINSYFISTSFDYENANPPIRIQTWDNTANRCHASNLSKPSAW